MESLLRNIEIIGDNRTVTSSTNVGSRLIDMHDCDGCLFLFVGSSASGSSKIIARIQGCTGASTTGTLYSYVMPGKTYTAGASTLAEEAISSSTGWGKAADFDYNILAVDVLKPHYRYNRLKITGCTSIEGSDQFICIKHHMRLKGSTTYIDSTSLGKGCSTVLPGLTTY